MDKVQVYNILKQSIQSKIDALQLEMDELTDSLSSSTKSSVGDKHETSRALLQIEQERIGNQLGINQQMIQSLSQINPDSIHKKIQIGSFVATSAGTFYIAISGGQINVSSDSIFCLSMNSPMGQALSGKSKGDKVVVNGKTIEILSIN